MRYSSRPGKGSMSNGAEHARPPIQAARPIGSNRRGVVVEPYLISLSEDSDVFPTFQHDGMEFLYMLEGEVAYRHSYNLYRLKPGDSLLMLMTAGPGTADPFADPVPVDHLLSAKYRQIRAEQLDSPSPCGGAAPSSAAFTASKRWPRAGSASRILIANAKAPQYP